MITSGVCNETQGHARDFCYAWLVADADGLSTKAKAIVVRERGRSLDHIYYQLNKERNALEVMNTFSSLLMITTSLQVSVFSCFFLFRY